MEGSRQVHPRFCGPRPDHRRDRNRRRNLQRLVRWEPGSRARAGAWSPHGESCAGHAESGSIAPVFAPEERWQTSRLAWLRRHGLTSMALNRGQSAPAKLATRRSSNRARALHPRISMNSLAGVLRRIPPPKGRAAPADPAMAPQQASRNRDRPVALGRLVATSRPAAFSCLGASACFHPGGGRPSSANSRPGRQAALHAVLLGGSPKV